MDVIEQFKSTITADLYPVRSVVEWESIDSRLAEFEPALSALRTMRPTLKPTELALALEKVSGLVELLNLLFVVPGGLGFEDGRELPPSGSKWEKGFEDVAQLYIELGLLRLLQDPDCIPARA